MLTEGPMGVYEDVRFNRPAADGARYTQEGLYTVSVENEYTHEQTVKRIYVGKDERILGYIAQGYTVSQIIDALNDR